MSEESKAELDELCRQAVKEKHDEQRAIELYNQVLRSDPKHVQALSSLGALHHSSGRLEEARELYELVLTIEPTRYRTVYNLGRLAHDLGSLGDAQKHYETVLSLDPDNVIACNALAFLGQLNQEVHMDYEGARRCYEASLERNPDHVRTLDHQCAWLVLTGHAEAASTQHARVMKLDPGHGAAMCCYHASLFSGDLLDSSSAASDSPAVSSRNSLANQPPSLTPPASNERTPRMRRSNSGSLLSRLSSSIKSLGSRSSSPAPRATPAPQALKHPAFGS